MTTISGSVGADAVRAAPKVKRRNAAIDHARSFLTLVVLLHHAVIPYTYFGHTDAKSWIGFDVIVLATDSFFMAMFFFLSGLFVWPGLKHKTPRAFFGDRLLRLGLPFVIAAFTVIPLAYYAIALRQNPDITFSAFWWKTITSRALAKRPDLVRLGAADVRSDGKPAVPAVADACRPDHQTVAAVY